MLPDGKADASPRHRPTDNRDAEGDVFDRWTRVANAQRAFRADDEAVAGAEVDRRDWLVSADPLAEARRVRGDASAADADLGRKRFDEGPRVAVRCHLDRDVALLASDGLNGDPELQSAFASC